MRPQSTADQRWSIILAGGEGTRLISLVHRWLDRPTQKQYRAFVGTGSMFQHTLDQATRLTSPDRTVTVVAHSHRHDALGNWRAGGAARFTFSRPTATRRPVCSCL